MSDLSTVRTEIKTWERTFKELNGSAPTVNDIKANQAIADKYKLYKRLSKAAVLSESDQVSKTTPVPSTPPRSTRLKGTPSILHSTSRSVEPTTPLAAFNPFSPQKRQKGKEKKVETHTSRQNARLNSTTKPQASGSDRKRSFSPDLVQSNPPAKASSSTITSSYTLPLPPGSVRAVSRARKRLRGEPVSPSPNKDKRRRVSSQIIIPFPKFSLNTPDEDEDMFDEADTSFVDNSPVKAPKGGKFFPALFENDLTPVNLFGVKMDLELANDTKKPQLPNKRLTNAIPRRPMKSSNITKTTNISLRDGDSESTLQPPDRVGSISHHSRNKLEESIQSESSSNRSSLKRTLSDEDINGDGKTRDDKRAKSPLIPPSPPPGNSQGLPNRSGKSKSYNRKASSRNNKKTKLQEGETEDDDSEDLESKSKLRIVKRHDIRFQHTNPRLNEDDITSDYDSIIEHTRFPAPHAASPNNSQLQDGDVEIDLPEQLRSVLALDPAPKIQVSHEDRLVKGLLYGRRVTSYHPNKGGEIWDVGEDDHDPDNQHTEGEDDWEGEPVPWEVGEL